jgi:bromodomain-containing protein 8
MLHSQISAHRNGNIFHNPIKNSEAPDYHEIVKRPMDLKTIKARIKDGGIVNSLEFQRDVYLMFANAMMYNRPRSDIYTMTDDVSRLCYSNLGQKLSRCRPTDDAGERTSYHHVPSNRGFCSANASYLNQVAFLLDIVYIQVRPC